MKNKLGKIILSVREDGRVGTLSWLFVIFLLIVVVATFLYEKLPLFLKFSLWGQDSFYAGIITNMHSSAIDFLFFSIGLYVVMIKHENQAKIKRYKENIDDTRFLFTHEAAFKNYANIRRLQELGIKSIDFSKCTLITTKPKALDLSNAMAMGAILDSANFSKSKFFATSFRGASAKGATFNDTNIVDCSMKYLKFEDGKMRASMLENVDFSRSELVNADFRATRFKNCCFKDASLHGCNMERADLRQSLDLTIGQLLTCKSLKYAKLDAHLESQVLQIQPNLLR